ncbi:MULTISPECIES: aldehyde dehydrogenase family protein [Rhodopseudomonas]|uniref:Aldehyde dehydrogenase n=1 Tax=Rhodopseudomonas palustris TaxID=1076 RepID=A0A0D7E3C6_RHOPL|nr:MULTISPECIES: aldehyde dehydrogenase family protein [Rhodopseudomonas]KIZ35364.1 aldehyde dehydrogenase [Rhodopseudomonas palustris]MDF3814081.1 aldehyde dehydrogenase family protein [Rhodopseudomonas sp. BAL398]WOK15766.1 aldehyde dehydrogenase family protein [Rhodopseudomonas sp. BAL398]
MINIATRINPAIAPAVAEVFQQLAGRHLIGNALVPPLGGATLDVLDPATGQVLGRAPAATADDVAQAVDAASAAFPGWAAIPARQRGKLLAQAAQRITDKAEVIAAVLALETGKALRTECRGELTVAADIVTMYAGLASELKGETLPFDPQILSYTTLEPLGVVAAILPWNVPLVLMMLKIAPALVAGNTVVVKASEEAPFATIEAARLIADLLPPGVLNVICGTGHDCGMALVEHPKVAKVTFTGSQAVGELIYQAAARKIIPVSLELGGKSPMIVYADADLPRAVAGAIAGMRFTRQGQSCTAASRIYVHASLFDAFLAGLRDAVEKLVIGDPLDEATDIGTVISQKQKTRVESYIARGEATPGAITLRCCALPTAGHLKDGLFLQPTIVTGLPEDSALMRDEIFGPVVCLQSWTDEDDVLAKANDSDFGLAATVWTMDLRTALRVTGRLDAGYVQVNQNLTIQPNLSYGGFKKSGLGKEASLEAMLEHFTKKKTIVIDMR